MGHHGDSWQDYSIVERRPGFRGNLWQLFAIAEQHGDPVRSMSRIISCLRLFFPVPGDVRRSDIEKSCHESWECPTCSSAIAINCRKSRVQPACRSAIVIFCHPPPNKLANRQSSNRQRKYAVDCVRLRNSSVQYEQNMPILSKSFVGSGISSMARNADKN